MTRKGARKGRSVTLPDAWFDELEAFKLRERLSLEKLGQRLADVMDEPVPIAVSTVHDYLRRRRGVTEELTAAFAQVAGLPVPPMGSESSDPEIVEWAELGRQLKLEMPERFRQNLETLRALIEALKRHRLR